MKLYKVTAKDCDYDQYDCFVIWANSESEAKELIIKEIDEFFPFENHFTDCEVAEVIKPSEPEILLGSFNAG